MARDLAIDLGTASTLVWRRGHGIVLDEPTVIALDQRSGAVLAMGDEAYDMVDCTPDHVVVERPLRGGAITDFDATARLLRLLLQRAGAGRLARPRVVLSVPTALTDVERRALEQAAERAGARAAYLIDEPLAAAIGAGLPVHEPIGTAVLDVGGGTADAALVSLGGIVVASGVRVGGLDLDQVIRQHVRSEHAVVIGERTAEEVKLTIGSAAPQPDEPKAEIRGRALASGMPEVITVSAEEIRDAIEDQVAPLVDVVLDVLATSPPELTQDVLDTGMWLVGGGALLPGLKERIAQATELAVHVVDRPKEVVVTGAGWAVERLDEVGHLFASADSPARR